MPHHFLGWLSRTLLSSRVMYLNARRQDDERYREPRNGAQPPGVTVKSGIPLLSTPLPKDAD